MCNSVKENQKCGQEFGVQTFWKEVARKSGKFITLSLKVILENEALSLIKWKSFTVWDITLCIPYKVNICFGGIRHFHLQGKIKNEARN
jgi:hypothetical protein